MRYLTLSITDLSLIDICVKVLFLKGSVLRRLRGSLARDTDYGGGGFGGARDTVKGDPGLRLISL